MAESKLPVNILVRTVLRSFFLQASWNFERLQNLGIVFTLAPALRHLYRGQELAKACRRHLEYFNTHPFMAAPVLGSILALEEKQAKGEQGYLDVHEFKSMIMAPYAAIGDAFFWGGVRPLAAAIALFFAAKGSLWAPVVFLLVFNIPHLWLRIGGFLKGYLSGLKVIEVIQRRRLPDLAIRIKECMVILLGGLSAYLTLIALKAEDLSTGWGLVVAPIVLFVGWLAARGFSSLVLVLCSSAILLILAQFENFLNL